MFAVSVVTPNLKIVFLVYGEAIIQQDGTTKNVCKRLLSHLRAILPNEKTVVLRWGKCLIIRRWRYVGGVVGPKQISHF